MNFKILAILPLLIFIPGIFASLIDTDGDLYTDALEILKGTDYLNPRIHPECCNGYASDTDGDGYLDGSELIARTDKFDKLSYPTEVDAYADTDGDGVSDQREYFFYGTEIDNVDSDGDGVSDADEIRANCCVDLDADTDGDGCTNAQEYDFSTDLADPNSYDLSCYNGGGTGAAVTEIGASSTTFTILIISVFVLIGSAIIYTLWRRKRRF